MDEVHLEHRLTVIENNTSDILEQLVKLNGKVYKHEEWIVEQKGQAREIKGFAAGRMSIHKRDMMLLGAALAIVQFVIPYIPVVLAWFD